MYGKALRCGARAALVSALILVPSCKEDKPAQPVRVLPAASSADSTGPSSGLRAASPPAVDCRKVLEGFLGEATARVAVIEQAVANQVEPCDPWAGKYSDGFRDTFEYVWVHPQAGFVWQEKFGFEVGRLNFGTAQMVHPGAIEFHSELDVGSPNCTRIPAQMYTVRWGPRWFLIPPDRLLEFIWHCNANRGQPQSAIGFLVQTGLEGAAEQEDSAPTRPEVATEFAHLILERPLKLSITQMGAPRTSPGDTNAAASRGNMELHVEAGEGPWLGREFIFAVSGTFGVVRVVDVAGNSLKGEYSIAGRLSEEARFSVPGTMIEAPGFGSRPK